MTARTTGCIFSIIVDGYIERVKGGKLDRCSVTVCRYDNDDADNNNWTSRGYPRYHPITAATRKRLTKYAPMATMNRKTTRSALVQSLFSPVLPASVGVPA